MIKIRKYRKQSLIASASMVLLALISLVSFGLKPSVDFAGGISSIVDIKDLNKIPKHVYNYAEVKVYKTQILINASNEYKEKLKQDIKNINVLSITNIGPKMGSMLLHHGIITFISVAIGVMLCTWLQFGNSFAIAAISALMQDVILIFGIISALRLEFNLAALAGIITLMGYSINDTVVIFSKLKQYEYTDNYDIPINAALPRTLVTSLTTIATLALLLFIPEKNIESFSTILIIGIVLGTYSSLFTATPIAMLMYKEDKDSIIKKTITNK